jgi:hypothetical protein
MHGTGRASLKWVAMFAGLCLAGPSWAEPPSDKPIPPLPGGLVSVTFAPPACKFGEMVNGFICNADKGSFRYAFGQWDVFMENAQNPNARKLLRLSIELVDKLTIDDKNRKVIFYAIDDWRQLLPVAKPAYDPPVKGPELFTLEKTSFLSPSEAAPGGTWQMLWSAYPQPAREIVTLRDWNMFIAWDKDGDGTIGAKEGETRLFDASWLKSLSLSSHCPEPGSWAMMIAGFGLVGAARRRAARGTGLQAR